MAVGEQDLRVLRALTEAREQHEELADLLDFYHDLYEVQFRAKEDLSEPVARDDLGAQWRLEGGIPQLAFNQLAVEPESFAKLVDEVTEVLMRYNPQWQDRKVIQTPHELVSLAQEVFESWDTLTAPRPEAEGSEHDSWAEHTSALAIGFALAPYLQQASEAISPHMALEIWGEGHCPICGGRPNFSLLEQETGARQLVCSRCNCQWPYARLGCPLCGSKEKQAYYPSEDGAYRLYVCPDCNRYLKTMDLRGVHREVYPTVERLLTVGMDLAAHEEGYGD